MLLIPTMQPQSAMHEPLWAVAGSRSLCRLLVKDNFERVRHLLEVSPSLINARHPLGWAPLHAAVLCCDPASLKFILDLPGVDIMVKDKSTFKASSSEADILCRNEELCPKIRGIEVTTGATALHFACMRGDPEILSLLFQFDREGSCAHDVHDEAHRLPKEYFNLERIDLGTLKVYQDSFVKWRNLWRSLATKDIYALCDAIRDRDLDYCKIIIEGDKKLVTNSYRSTFKTIVSTFKSMTPTSVDVSRIIPSEPEYGSGSTALHYACLVGDMKVVDLLLRNGVKWTSEDGNEMLPEGYVRIHGDERVAEFNRLCEEEEKRRKDIVDAEERAKNAKLDEKEESERARKALENGELTLAGELAEYMEMERQGEFKSLSDEDKKKRADRVSKSDKRVNKASRKKETKDKKKEGLKKLAEDKFRMRHLAIEKIIGSNVVGQRGPIRSIASAIRLRENGWVDPDRPLVLLFLGSSGIGKTEIAKRVASYLHRDMKLKPENSDDDSDDEDRGHGKKDQTKEESLRDIEKSGTFVRIDMSEYQHRHTVSNLTGSPKGYVGYDEGGILTKKLRKNPKAVVLLDEIEKAHPDVLTVFLQLFDDGRITDPKYGTIHCPNAVFIMTSNLGSEEIRLAAPALHALISRTEAVNKHEQYLQGISDFNKTLYPVLKQSFKRDEFLGRINQIVVFLPFSDKEINRIVRIELNKWKKRAQQHHEIKLSWSPEVLSRLAQGYDVNYGARSVTNEVKSCAIQVVAESQIRGDIKKTWYVRLVVNEAGNIDIEAKEPQTPAPAGPFTAEVSCSA